MLMATARLSLAVTPGRAGLVKARSIGAAQSELGGFALRTNAHLRVTPRT